MSAKEAVHYRSCAGGGYGDPRQRDPARVLADINRRWLSVSAARKVFGVSVANAPNGIDYVLDEVGTARLRKSRTQSKTVARAKTAARGRRK
jgi:N-methylhydantoinase B